MGRAVPFTAALRRSFDLGKRMLEMLAAGDSVEDVLTAFPSLRREQVLACVDHAARLMGNQYSLERVA